MTSIGPIRCPQCGSIYDGEAIARLSWQCHNYRRVEGRIYQPIACLCEVDRDGMPFGYTMNGVVPGGPYVIVSVTPHSGIHQRLGVPSQARDGRVRVYVEGAGLFGLPSFRDRGIELERHWFDATTGIGTSSDDLLLMPEELAVALRLLEEE